MNPTSLRLYKNNRLHFVGKLCTRVLNMTSKQPKKSNKKKAPAKKAPVKKAPASKKASASKSTIGVHTKDTDLLLSKVGEQKTQFVGAEKMMKAIAETSTVVRANDIKSKSIRQKMLAWFKISK